MKRLLIVSGLAIALSGCQGTNGGSWNPFGSRSKGPTAEERAQQCSKQGLRPGTQRFKMCMDRAAEDSVGQAPPPRKKPVRATSSKPEGQPESWGGRMMKKVGSLFE